ncbi:L-histidine N(alpha)-methyltransferase [Pontibacter akesuensis]|uniref:4-dimethylallyltryptophan N-methyltransferase n=1 Tax=Pontibacter akesuensis TaxID=388950 RepID=A0A1I7FY62_9BACT|nr:L-histidine N(alpha)-methyltransferase [Pontibacter akesuensis]GHA59918.1 dimethylhistidine N-methyltransferase [Pontibacter akesuensis]SFU41097.1 dimethylhistidine N-methyltransferase [Pontibacter akesuensis]
MNTKVSPVIDLSRKKDGTNDLAAFTRDVAEGLNRKQKHLPSRYFYDGKGSRLFQQIMDLPEYYLTRSEFEVLTENREAMAAQFSREGYFHLIDLGAGDALKTKILLHELARQQCAFDYVPVDISGDAMQQLTESLHTDLPQVRVEAVVGEYFTALEWLQENKSERKVLLFLGSNIGNFEELESIAFLKEVRSYLQPGDRLLMGIDLRKNPDTILAAYNDKAGVTAAFNLNLLHRINRELGGNFNVDQFYHYAMYNPGEGVMRSFLVSKTDQEVFIRETGQKFHFEAWEAIHTENSHKYSLPQVAELGETCGFQIETVFYDGQKRFADVLFTVR